MNKINFRIAYFDFTYNIFFKMILKIYILLNILKIYLFQKYFKNFINIY